MSNKEAIISESSHAAFSESERFASASGRTTLSAPPLFGACVRFFDGPMMVVADAEPLPSGADPHCVVTVMYLDDSNILHCERIPWGILSECSAEILEAERDERYSEMDAEYAAREAVRAAARVQSLRDGVAISSDPASLFCTLRESLLALLKSLRDVDVFGPASGLSDDASDGSRVVTYSAAPPDCSGVHSVRSNESYGR